MFWGMQTMLTRAHSTLQDSHFFCISEFSCKDDIEIIVIVPNFCKTKRFLKINVVVGPLNFFYNGDALNIVLAFSLLFFFPWFAKCSMWNFGGSDFNLFVVLKVHMTTLSSCGICAAKAVFYPWTMDALWNVLQFFLLVEFAYQQVRESSNSYLHICTWSVLVFVVTTVI